MLDIQEMSLNIKFVSGTRKRVATMRGLWMVLPLPLSSQESQGSDHFWSEGLQWWWCKPRVADCDNIFWYVCSRLWTKDIVVDNQSFKPLPQSHNQLCLHICTWHQFYHYVAGSFCPSFWCLARTLDALVTTVLEMGTLANCQQWRQLMVEYHFRERNH